MVLQNIMFLICTAYVYECSIKSIVFETDMWSETGMKIKFGNVSIEFPYEKFLKDLGSMENPFGARFPKSSQDFYKAFSKMTPSSFSDYFEDYRKSMEKHIKMSKRQPKR